MLMNIRWWIYDEYSLFDPILDPNKFIPTLYYRPPNCDLDIFIPYLSKSYIKRMGRVSRGIPLEFIASMNLKWCIGHEFLNLTRKKSSFYLYYLGIE
jgi:hypothetical protein